MPQPAAPTRSKWNVNAKKAEEPPKNEVGNSDLFRDTVVAPNGSPTKDNTAFGQKSVISDYTVANTPKTTTNKAEDNPKPEEKKVEDSSQ